MTEKTICANCKWAKLYEEYISAQGEGFYRHYAGCSHPEFSRTELNIVTGKSTKIIKSCKSVNDGNCPHYEFTEESNLTRSRWDRFKFWISGRGSC